MAITVEVTGDFLVESSLARVNRGLFGALAARPEIDLAVLAEPTAAVLEGTRADDLLQATRTKRFLPDPDVTIRHRWPAVFARVRSGAYVHVQPWEFGALPARWAEHVRAVADEVWAYSTYVAEVYLRAGVPEERVAVVPLGYDPEVFAPGPPPSSALLRDRCVFLYVGDTIARKGADIAVNAYVAAFKPGDDVVLVVKDFGAKTPGDDTRLRDHVMALSHRRDIPPILYVDTTYTDAALADLYRAAAALVAPYRGEGFGLPVLEAMACGIPAIVTRGGATDDFTDEETALHVDASPRRLGREYRGFELVEDGFLLEPSEPQVVERMRQVYADRGAARALGARAAAKALGWTWEHAAACAVERLRAVAEREPLSARRGPQMLSELNRFELKIASRGGEDGILLELFRRIGVDDPFFVECVASGDDPATTTFLARSLGWHGAVMEGDSAAYACIGERLGEARAPEDLDLLVLGAGSDPAWARFGPYRPHLVVTPGGAPPVALAASCGYALLGIESSASSAFFVRDDLVGRTRLPTAPAC